MAVINGTGGLVELITLRTIVLRDVEGTVHVFPNGGITTLANRSKDYSYAPVIDVSVVYKEDIDRVSEVLRGVGDDVRADEALHAGPCSSRSRCSAWSRSATRASPSGHG